MAHTQNPSPYLFFKWSSVSWSPIAAGSVPTTESRAQWLQTDHGWMTGCRRGQSARDRCRWELPSSSANLPIKLPLHAPAPSEQRHCDWLQRTSVRTWRGWSESAVPPAGSAFSPTKVNHLAARWLSHPPFSLNDDPLILYFHGGKCHRWEQSRGSFRRQNKQGAGN